MRRALSAASLATLVTLIIACGGGGDSVSQPVPAPPVVPPCTSISTLAGLAGSAGTADGTGTGARFTTPRGLARDAQGNLFISEETMHTLRKITPAGVVTTYAGLAATSGTTNGSLAEARFYNPTGLALDPAGNLYVAEYYNHCIRKITPSGVVSTFAGMAGVSGFVQGSGGQARFMNPIGIAFDAAGNLVVADSGNCAIRIISPAGTVTTMAGAPGLATVQDGPVATAQFRRPFGVAVDRQGTVYVSEFSAHVVRKISGGMVSTLAGQVDQAGGTDGSGSQARFSKPALLTVDEAGNLYVPDWEGATLRRVTPAGVVTTVMGKGGTPGAVDGPAATALLRNVFGACVAGPRVFLTDSGNCTVRVID